MKEITVLIAGQRGYGMDDTGLITAKLFGKLGYNIYMYNDFPSLIRGGHQYIIVRASTEKIGVHKDKVDIVLAYNQDALDKHKDKFNEKTIIIYDREKVVIEDLEQTAYGLSLNEILKGKGTITQLGGICLIAGLCKSLNIDIKILEGILKKDSPTLLEQKLDVAYAAYSIVQVANDISNDDKSNMTIKPILSGSQAISLGLLKTGLQSYIAYPMTPTSQILEFLAGYEEELGLHIVLPESEIAVILMALGYSYMGIRSAVGTSGGGFSLMVEALGLAGQAELPVVIVMGQRAGPSTGMPTYTGQTDLHFVLNASQGEFPRFIVAPGDAEEAYYWSGIAMNKAWQYQLPAFVLVDKTLSLGYYSFEQPELKEEEPNLWDGKDEYKRYSMTANGISPLAFPPLKGQAIKTNSYVHNEFGITTENPQTAKYLADKRILKEQKLAKELEGYNTVKSYGQGKTALLCWGSNKGVCLEIAKKYNLKTIQVVVMSPFPTKKFTEALEGIDRLISVECNSRGQLGILLQQNGFKVDEQILKYDGRPFSLEDLDLEVKKVLK